MQVMFARHLVSSLMLACCRAAMHIDSTYAAGSRALMFVLATLALMERRMDAQALLCLQVVDQAPMLTPGETHKYCVRATGGAVAITIAWADFPCR